MKYLSVCSGIESASVAWHSLGWKPVGFSEIEPFPSAVLNHHFPEIKNYGDMTQFKEWNIEPGTIDLLVGGTPCQSFSVAGLRKGLTDPRGNLMLTYGSIAKTLQPRWIVWENVPGVLSSNGGRDFGTFLGMLAELGYGFAYRILDAQYVRVESHRRAVPQRRRRVFVIGYLGDWRRAAAVLFESESMCRYTPPSRKAGERVAPNVTVGPPFSRTGNDRVEAEAMIPVLMDQGGSVMSVEDNVSGTLRRETKGHEPIFTQPYTVGNCLTRRMHKGINTTLDEGQTPVLDIKAFTVSKNSGGFAWEKDISPTIDVSGGKMPNQQYGVRQGYSVRRLTPEECERLQGFPTGWTRIPWRNKSAADCPDGPRYKAIGNSMAVNVMQWIGERIDKVCKSE